MLRKLRPRSIYDVFAVLALFVALGGTAPTPPTPCSARTSSTARSSPSISARTRSVAPTSRTTRINTFDVHSFLGVDVVDGSLTGDDIKDEFLTGLDINNGSLNDEDVGQATFVDFLATIGPVAAQGCAYLPITGINATGDHLLLTPSSVDAAAGFIYSVQYRQAQESAFLVACNNNSVVVDDGTTHFNLLVFDAQ